MRAKENGPGAAATALRAGIVVCGKPTDSDNPNPEAQQSQFASPDNTGRKQGRGVERNVRLSLRTAIDAMCRSCIYDPEGGNGTWREQVQACSSGNCPLHAVRPITVKAQKRGTEARHVAAVAFQTPNAGMPLPDGRLGLNGLIPEQRRAA